MEEIKKIIDINLPKRDLIWTGICVERNKNVSILINYDEKKKEFNGYTVFKSKEIKRYRYWGKNECRGVKIRTSFRFMDKIKSKNSKTFYSSLKEASQFGLIAFFVENKTNSYFVGQLTSVNNEFANFRLIDRKARWARYKKIKLKNINFFSFGTVYERTLFKKVDRKRGIK